MTQITVTCMLSVRLFDTKKEVRSCLQDNRLFDEANISKKWPKCTVKCNRFSS